MEDNKGMKMQAFLISKLGGSFLLWELDYYEEEFLIYLLYPCFCNERKSTYL